LAAKAPGHLESAVALARAAIDASEFARAREALAPFVAAPTQRVAMLMAEIERTEHGDSGRAREWTLRAVRAMHDPVWTADGYVSDRWRPVSPVTGQLDAFQWQMPLAALPSEHAVVVEPEPVREPLLAPPLAEAATADVPVPAADAPVVVEEEHAAESPPVAAAPVTAAPPVFRARQDMTRKTAAPVPPVIPIVRAPDDPGVDEDSDRDEFDGHVARQAGGWRGFVSRWVG
jgi:HemY protein